MKKIIDGFTIIELLVVIAVIGILTTIGIVSFSSIQSSARDTQRSSKITAVSEALEKYFSSNGEYPSCAAMTVTPASTVTTNTLKGLDPDTLTTPSATKGTNSITSCVANPTSDTFSYFGGTTDYTLKYKEDSSGNVISLDGRHHIVIPTYTLTITAGTGGTVNTAVNGTYTSGSTPTITATPNTYHYATWSGSAGCVTGADSHTILMDGNKTCVAEFKVTPVTAPSTPIVNNGTVGATTTWTWGAASCSGGNSPQYRYDYTISPAGFDSGWVTTSTPSVALTTSTEGQTYAVAVQAQCYNTATSSNWSGSGSANYYRPVACPSGFIVVPGSITYGTADFCVMKYGAKNVGGVATSQAALTPWVSISQTTAITTSAAACSGCHLITEAEYLTITQNVLNVSSNWSSGTVGTGYIYSGHHDNAPANALAADSSDANGYAGETNTGGNQRRTLTLSNGEVIWDLAGNVYEWTSGQTNGITAQQPGVTGGGLAWREWTAVTNPGTLSPNPSPATTGISGASSWNNGNGIGRINSSADETGLRGFLRGGPWNGGSYVASLTLDLGTAPSGAKSSIGFRVSK